ncbi:hypothetical protein BCR44DRAFT_71055 [Catenaria anguillulae PL171]|uniref:Calcineurin-like phosphoesterase domain-containing protein n=1 Tax=Catenaria anguillulae PL171 TaxID=765915 RepID=A0A1Y2I293_9FUNG|nr:hypothetical protein BCR44DRAFT_71055 [Catenaria anguillulae PL171]
MPATMYRLWRTATRVVERRPLSTSAVVSTLAATAYFLEPNHNVTTNSSMALSHQLGRPRTAILSTPQALAMGAVTGVPDGVFFGFWYPHLDKAVKLLIRSSFAGVVITKTAAELALGACADRYGTILNQAGLVATDTTVPPPVSEDAQVGMQSQKSKVKMYKTIAALVVAAPFHAAMFVVVPVPWQAIAGSVSVVNMPAAVTAVSLVVAVVIALAPSPTAAFGSLCRPSHSFASALHSPASTSASPIYPPPNTRIAFLGDQGLTPHSSLVLSMIRDWRADAAVALGDFDYADDPHAWDSLINSTMGPAFPFIGVIGNHDIAKWNGPDGYAEIIARRIHRSGLECSGNLGTSMECNVHGVHMVFSGVGTFGTGHEQDIRARLGRSQAAWKVCGWHKNQRAFQTGNKPDETGYGVYDACREAGAVVATAHEHAYARTHLMGSFEGKAMVNGSQPTLVGVHNPPWQHLDVRPGQSFAFVSGLGGESVRGAYFPDLPKRPWLAAVATADTPDVRAGALLCEFHVHGDPHLAECIFKDAVSGKVFDRFTVSTTPATAKLATVATASPKRSCRKTIDVPLARHESWPSQVSLATRRRRPVSFTFDLPAGSKGRIVAAHLQVMGAHSLRNLADQPNMYLVAQASTVPRRPNSAFGHLWQSLSQRVLLSSSPSARQAVAVVHGPMVRWTADEWEAHEVWVSPNLFETSSWLDGARDRVVVDLVADGEDAKSHAHVYAGGPLGGGCLAPSLMVHLDVC